MIHDRLFVLFSVLLLFVLPGAIQAAAWDPLPDTGQVICWDNNGIAQVPCPPANRDLHGQDPQYHGLLPSYTPFPAPPEAAEIITDNNTGLVWQQGDDGTPRNWTDAGTYCDTLTLASQSDWRLPTKFELLSIIDYGSEAPAIDPYFSCQYRINDGDDYSYYWSSTEYAGDNTQARRVNFLNGIDDFGVKTTVDNHYVRCVRDSVNR